MKVLVIGSGGRESALCYKLKSSPSISEIHCLPGSDGIEQWAKCIKHIPMTNVTAIAQYAMEQSIDLTIVGPEIPLTLGIADVFIKNNMTIFGPDQKASQLESSKSFAKAFMKNHHIPTAHYAEFNTLDPAIQYIQSLRHFPVVIKLDGLAAGKGVTICYTLSEASKHLQHLYTIKTTEKIIIEEFLTGYEVSILAICDGNKAIPLITAQDHKTLYENNKGPNTGGMGAYAPVPMVSEELFKTIQAQIIQPTMEGLKQENIHYKGVLYFGIMIDKENKPYILEYNARFGDPEIQAIIPLLNEDLAEICWQAATGNLSHKNSFQFHPYSSVCVVLSSEGYPETFSKGNEITGLSSVAQDILIFHSGTYQENNKYYTNGGRVLSIVATDALLEKAIEKAYLACSHIKFHNVHYRKDIATQAIQVHSSP